MASVESKNVQTLLKSFARANALPLDRDEVWESISAVEQYLSSPMAYAGQTVKVKMEDGKYQSFTLQPHGEGEEIELKLEELKGSVDESQLKKYVVFVDELPQEGQETEVIYFVIGTFIGYVWTGSEYVKISKEGIVEDTSNFAKLDGATFTGSVVLAAEPMEDLEAATKSYVDNLEEYVENSQLKKKYEISSKPDEAIVDYREKEIRVFCPENTEWKTQEVGPTGNAKMYYMGFKAYAPENAVSFKEGDQGVIVDEIFTFDDDFAGIDKYGRKYSICWLALASQDDAGEWTYFGKKSSTQKYIGWTYVVEWYDENGNIINSDKIRINLSNESCHSQIEPSYLFAAKQEAINEANAYTNNALTWGTF